MKTPTTFHLREEAQKIIGENDGVPDAVFPEMVQAALEKSDVDLDSLSQEKYDNLFWHTKGRLQEILQEVDNE